MAQKTEKKYTPRRDLRESSMCSLGSWLTTFNWDCVLNLSSVNEKVHSFYEIFCKAIEIFLLARRVRVCSSDKPWVSSRLKSLVSRRQSAFKALGKDSAIFKMFRNKVQKEARNCKRSYFNSKVSSLKDTNVSKWWAEAKALSGLTARSEWWHQLIDTPTTDAFCKKFNTFLENVTSHFASCATTLPVPPDFLVSDHQAYKALCSMKAKKSSAPDPLPSRLWKEFAYELAPVVANINNSSLKEGHVPKRLKSSYITPTPKVSPPKVIEEDLRPITLTSPLAKILEGFTLDLLTSQVIKKLDIKQFSVSGKSTTHALVYMLHVILEALYRGNNYVRIFFADFSKGFDLVDHHSLLNEMRSLDVHPVITRWVFSFLTDRSQRVRIGSSLSLPVSPNGGIPSRN
ncbi:uncharacterized protein LOC125559895 [Nematostella vectensis]|uniref:uncharacterized protein LOC125559895 n=1 Tax=Nematostella vectensis TaxID=45351 RepID=UPI00207728F7|nr:uncharacterized protein LOC125559895 [Nematostella vectensis]